VRFEAVLIEPRSFCQSTVHRHSFAGTSGFDKCFAECPLCVHAKLFVRSIINRGLVELDASVKISAYTGEFSECERGISAESRPVLIDETL
jgi:hypothetical protein